MNKFIIISIVGLTSCIQTENTTENKKVNDTLPTQTMTMLDSSHGKMYAMDDVHKKFLDTKLVDYLQKEHPNWSIPNENMWYPELFKKYKSDSSLVSIISGDFDGNGNKDYALLIDQGNGILSAVAFLYDGRRYKTQRLTEIPAIEKNKIIFRLRLYQPGKFSISDPDLDPGDVKVVNFKHPAIGVGHFEELYEGGDDVYYWDGNQLKSCVIDKN